MATKIGKENFDASVLDKFAKLDDVDILSAIKEWQDHDDFVLSKLCQMVINRQLLKIKLKNNWYSSDIVYTNARGCWAHGEKYSNRISMQVIFENENLKVRNTTYWLGIRVTKSPKRMINNPPYNNILTQFDDKEDRREWACSHTLNTDYEYRQAVVIDGVPLPRTRINYLLKPGDGDASAAMLQNNPFNSWLAFLVAMKFPIGTLLTTGLQPDITNQYALKENYKSFKDVTVHELGHASHYSLVGESYWIGYRDHIIINDGYGDFGSFKVGSSPGKVALGEAIGNYAQVTYGYINRNPEKSTFENGFIPDGLMYDLEDSNQDPITDPITSTIIQDKVSGFTPAMIFNALRPNVVNINSFGNRLRSLHLNDTNNNFNDFNNLIDVYDVFN